MSFQAKRLRVQLPCGEGTLVEQALPGPAGGGCGATACGFQTPINCGNSCRFPTVDCGGGTCFFQSQGCQGFNTNCGFASPCQNFGSPCPGFNTNCGFASPCQGFNSPCQGFNSPCQGFNSPCQGFNSPCPGFNTNCGFASPCQNFGSPCDAGSACGPQSLCGPGSVCGPGTPVGCPGASRDIVVNPERFVIDAEVLPVLREQLEAQLKQVEIAEQALKDLESEE